MTNYVKNYRKKDVTKAYDLLELKANGRIDEDGDYLDDDGCKLTKTRYLSRDRLGAVIYRVIRKACGEEELVALDDFICVGVDGGKWCISRDEFLATY